VNDPPRTPRKPRQGHPGRRQPPPDATGREAALYRTFVDDNRPVTVQTTDGQCHRGTIEDFDDDHIALRSQDAGGAAIRIALRSVRSIEAD
jgi:hypothetical protein